MPTGNDPNYSHRVLGSSRNLLAESSSCRAPAVFPLLVGRGGLGYTDIVPQYDRRKSRSSATNAYSRMRHRKKAPLCTLDTSVGAIRARRSSNDLLRCLDTGGVGGGPAGLVGLVDECSTARVGKTERTSSERQSTKPENCGRVAALRWAAPHRDRARAFTHTHTHTQAARLAKLCKREWAKQRTAMFTLNLTDNVNRITHRPVDKAILCSTTCARSCTCRNVCIY